jgi:hypothetical protein
MSEENSWSAQTAIDWLFGRGYYIADLQAFLQEFSRTLTQCEAPVDRVQITILTFNPQIIGTTVRWLRATNVTQRTETDRQIRGSDRYIGSPLTQLFDTEDTVRQRLTRLPSEAHKTFTDLADEGF